VIKLVQRRYLEISAEELKALHDASEEESLKIALGIASQPPPPIPEFELEDKLKNAKDLSEFIDDFFENRRKDDDKQGFNVENADRKNGFEDFETGYDDVFENPGAKKTGVGELYEEEEELDSKTEEELAEECESMKKLYNVIIGVSWGNLPYDLQEKWRLFKCDAYLTGY
jgi:hypothetical protein